MGNPLLGGVARSDGVGRSPQQPKKLSITCVDVGFHSSTQPTDGYKNWKLF